MLTNFFYGNKEAFLFDQSQSSSPLFLMYVMDEKEAKAILERLTQTGLSLSMAFLITPDWDKAMTPFAHPRFCLEPLAEKTSLEVPGLLQAIEKALGHPVTARYLIGYSLGGLFAVYEGMKGLFDGIASISGSMWFPGIFDYVNTCDFPKSMQKAYFSIGNRENGKPNSPFARAIESSQEMAGLFQRNGVKTRFELNEGGHFVDFADRSLKGIAYLAQGE